MYENRNWMRRLNRSFGSALAFSSALHMLAVWILLRQSAMTRESRQTITVEFHSPRSVQLRISPAPHPRVDSGQRSQKAKSLPLSAFKPKWSIQSAQNAPSDNEIQAPSSWTDSQAYNGAQLSTFEGITAGQADFLSSLWRMIDQYIEENPFLSEYNHTGQVFLRFEVDENGKFENRSFSAKADDRILKVIAARAVRKAVRNETGDVHFPRQRTVIHARFTWASYQLCRSLRGIKGKNLSFCHFAENRRKNFSAGEKVGTYAANILQHGPWAYEEIQKYRREESRRKAKFDPFEEFRRDRDWGL